MRLILGLLLSLSAHAQTPSELTKTIYNLYTQKIASLNTNQNITMVPNGTGKFIFSAETANAVPYLDADKKLKTSAIAPSDGYVLTYNNSSSAWEPAAPVVSSGDITDVVAGTNLTGGGSSGSVTLNLDNPIIVDVTGDLTGNADTSSAFDHNPSSCSPGDFVTDTDADGTLTCATPSSPTLYYQTVQANGSDQTQRAKLNFGADFSLTDNASYSKVEVGAFTGDVTKSQGSLATTVTKINGNAVVLPISVTFDGGGTIPTVGSKRYTIVPYNCTVVNWRMVLDQSGSGVVDVYASSFSTSTLPSSSIAGAEKPTVSSTLAAEDTSLGTWTPTIAAGTMIGFNLDSVTTANVISVILGCQL